jgi:hypothetical protein
MNVETLVKLGLGVLLVEENRLRKFHNILRLLTYLFNLEVFDSDIGSPLNSVINLVWDGFCSLGIS